MKKILLCLMVMVSMGAAAQKPAYEVSEDPKNGRVVFSGLITFTDLEKEPTFGWLAEGRDNYTPRKKQLQYLQEHLKEYKMVVFMGTWCPDSHELIPKFQKILQLTGYPLSGLAMYGVDRSKKLKTGAEKEYNITSVPTFILLRNGKEAGRITETVHKRIEIDLARIIKQDQ